MLHACDTEVKICNFCVIEGDWCEYMNIPMYWTCVFFWTSLHALFDNLFSLRKLNQEKYNHIERSVVILKEAVCKMKFPLFDVKYLNLKTFLSCAEYLLLLHIDLVLIFCSPDVFLTGFIHSAWNIRINLHPEISTLWIK